MMNTDTQTGVISLVIKEAEETDVGPYECEVILTNIRTTNSI